jgi:hypothetical protein
MDGITGRVIGNNTERIPRGSAYISRNYQRILKQQSRNCTYDSDVPRKNGFPSIREDATTQNPGGHHSAEGCGGSGRSVIGITSGLGRRRKGEMEESESGSSKYLQKSETK